MHQALDLVAHLVLLVQVDTVPTGILIVSKKNTSQDVQLPVPVLIGSSGPACSVAVAVGSRIDLGGIPCHESLCGL